MGFIGVCRAVYAYSPQNEEELAISEGDLLYLLERGDDGWWTVKRRVPGATAEEPRGLVPHNYVETAPVIGHAHALYSYTPQNPEEELGFSENDQFDIYAEDGDWVLVGRGSAFGFVPANYIERDSGSSAPAQTRQPSHVPAQSIAQPPSRSTSESEEPFSSPPPLVTDADAPPRPARPGHRNGDSISNRSSRSARTDLDRDLPSTPVTAPRDVEWHVQEINGKRKISRTLLTSPSIISISGGSGRDAEWQVENLISYSSEKRHVFLELQHPRASLDLKLESQDKADQLVALLGQVVGAQRGGGGLDEVFVAASSAGQRQGRVALDFKAANGREVDVTEGEVVWVLNGSDKDWWMVRTAAGREGLVPRKFIEWEKEQSSLLGFSRPRLKREKAERERERDRERESRERERREMESRERKEREREHHRRHSSHHHHRPPPDSRKVRTWVDRSGTFRVEAALLGCSDGKVHLHKLNGVKIAVPAQKLSLADIEYVESVTGVSLESDKPLVDKAGTSKASSATPAKSAPSEEGYDWFAFFLDCGIDIGSCTRYAANFTRDRMDESVLPDITPSTLRTLGLREGDILRVTKKLNEKFGRTTQSTGGLFGTSDGALHDNSGSPQTQPTTSPPVTPQQSSLQPQQTQPQAQSPAQPIQSFQPIQPQPTQSQPVQTQPTGALADLLGYTTVQQPQKTLQPQKTAEDLLGEQQRQHQAQILRQQAELQQQQIRLLKEQQEQLRRQQQDLQRFQTGRAALGPFATGVAALSTGAPAGGWATQASSVLAAPPPPQPRGFAPIQTGVPTGQATPFTGQATGPFGQPTGQFNQQTGQFSQPMGQFSQPTGQFGQTTGQFNQPTGQLGNQPTGPFTNQATGQFGQSTGVLGSQPTGPFASQSTGPFASQSTGSAGLLGQSQVALGGQPTGPFSQPTSQYAAPVTSQATGPFSTQPTTPSMNMGSQFPQTFTRQPTGPLPNQPTGPFASQPTGPFANQPTTSFASQPTGPFAGQYQPTGAPPAQTFPQQPTGPFAGTSQSFGAPASQFPVMQPQASYSTSQPPQSTFPQTFSTGAQPAQTFPSQHTGPFQSQSTGPFGRQPTGPFQPQSAFGQQLQQQQQQRTGTTTFPGAMGSFATPAAAGAPLQSQATGFGFGNSPQTQAQQNRPQAPNLAMATASNPFGF